MIGKPTKAPSKAISVFLDAFGALGSFVAPLLHEKVEGLARAGAQQNG